MSLNRTISLSFTDGAETVYSRYATISIPFLVSRIVVKNCIFYSFPTEPVGCITCNGLIENGSNVLTIIKNTSNVSEISHIYRQPKNINGMFNFTVDFGNTLIPLLPVEGQISFLFYGANRIHITSVQQPTIGQMITAVGLDLPCLITGYIGQDPDGDIYSLSSSQNDMPEGTVFNGYMPNVFVGHDLGIAKVVVDIEFNESFNLYKELPIINAEYVYWRFDLIANASKVIDIRFPVDSIEITQIFNENILGQTVYGFFSNNLLYSSTSQHDVNNSCLINTLGSMSYAIDWTQLNPLTYRYTTPRRIGGLYNISCIDTLTGMEQESGATTIMIRFIQYTAESGR